MSDEAQNEVKPTGSYRPRPRSIEAVLWMGEKGGLVGGIPSWLREAMDKTPVEVGGLMRVGHTVHVGTPRGILIAEPGDRIVRYPDGTLGVVWGLLFAFLYEEGPAEA